MKEAMQEHREFCEAIIRYERCRDTGGSVLRTVTNQVVGSVTMWRQVLGEGTAQEMRGVHVVGGERMW